ncbi:YqaA family protein [Catenovulum adriaticum]|uniref:VTT domain-containing protein n=1 Tax=Catenovulum adriaticum TaxID=2984846 RepID=A0ABY7ARK8_9ALTE|nr:VTT domain-containing protein [Catenovulum sp. TS8]WAJ72178.1 VTT domain-containing protein [Catenovulum sp. TS8]
MDFSHTLKQKTQRFINSRHMLKALTLASFLESIIVPIPLETILVPLMQAKRDKLWLLAFLATLGCLLGALAGYAFGYYLFDLIGDWAIANFSDQQTYEHVKQQMNVEGFWFVLMVGIIPIPFQIAMLAAGATQYPLHLFLLAAVIARSLRYFGLALVVYFAGNQAQQLIARYRWKAVAALALGILLIWFVVKQF